jgi:hypothetical protein
VRPQERAARAKVWLECLRRGGAACHGPNTYPSQKRPAPAQALGLAPPPWEATTLAPPWATPPAATPAPPAAAIGARGTGSAARRRALNPAALERHGANTACHTCQRGAPALAAPTSHGVDALVAAVEVAINSIPRSTRC